MLLPVLLGGCAASRVEVTQHQAQSDLSDIAFLHYLPTAPTLTVEEGLRAAVLALDPPPETPPQTFEGHLVTLRSRNIIRHDWSLDPAARLDKGTWAYLLRHLAHVPYGLNDCLAGLTGIGSRRYALRGCIHAGLLGPGLVYQPISGGEVLSSLSRIEARHEDGAPIEP